MIICDTREKKWEHVRRYFEHENIPYEVHKLDFGDYMSDADPTISIDRKQNLDELAGNLCTPSHRFWREAKGAYKAGIRMVVLIQDGSRHELKDVLTWSSNYSRISGRMLFEKMFGIANAYGVEFRFCDKKDTGHVIATMLGEEN